MRKRPVPLGEGSVRQVVDRGLPELVSREIVELINSGVFRPGDRLTEEPLARQLGTSRIPVREALRDLASRGVLVHEARKGYHVRALTAKVLDDIFTTRRALEDLALVQIVASSESHLERSRAALDDLKRSVSEGNVKLAIESDAAFHQFIVEASGNRILTNAYSVLLGHLIPALALAIPDELNDDLVAQHADLLSALERRDSMAAFRALEYHHRQALERLSLLVQGNPAGDRRSSGVDHKGDDA